jgi:hypothetical protein
MITYRVVAYDGAEYEVTARTVSLGHGFLIFADELAGGMDDVPVDDTAKFVVENVLCYYPVEANGMTLPERVKRISESKMHVTNETIER